MAEVIKSQILDLHRVALRAETELLWRCDVVELAVVARGHRFEAIADEVSIELHQKAHQSYVVGRDVLPHVAVVGVAVGRVLRRLQPRVDAINAEHRLELVRIVALVQQLAEGVRGEHGVLGASLGNFNELDRVA